MSRSLKQINVVSCDSVTIEADSDTVRVSPYFREILENNQPINNGYVIEVKEINGETLNQVLWWMNNHTNDKDLEDPEPLTLDAWDRDFLDTPNIVAIINAASILSVRKLYLQAIKKLAENVNEKFADKQPIKKIRKMLNIRNEFSKSECAVNKTNPIFESLLINNEFEIRPDRVGVVYLPPRELPLGYDEMRGGKQTKEKFQRK